MALYHVSATAGLKVLRPYVSTHKMAYVYAIDNVVTGLLFGARQDDFDLMIFTDENSTPNVYECYPGAFQSVYQGKSCSIYELEDEGFQRGLTSWEPELVCGHEVEIKKEVAVADLYGRLLKEEENGAIVIYRYAFNDEYRKRISAHVIDRLIRFDVDLDNCMEQDERFSNHYGELIRALRSAMDGHLLK